MQGGLEGLNGPHVIDGGKIECRVDYWSNRVLEDGQSTILTVPREGDGVKTLLEYR